MTCTEIFREDEFLDSPISSYLMRIFFRESKKVTYRLEYTSPDNLIDKSHSKFWEHFGLGFWGVDYSSVPGKQRGRGQGGGV